VNAIAPYLVMLWLPVGLWMFSRYPKPIAVLAIALLGTLFLPEVQWSPIQPDAARPIRLPMIEPTKVNMISYALLAGWLLVDGGKGHGFRIGWYDLPALGVCMWTAVSSAINDQNSNDIFFELRTSTLYWGVPYLMGRIYLSGPNGLRLATAALVIGGLLYIPFCLLEMRLSPTLHLKTFGFHQHSFLQTVRADGTLSRIFGPYRPMVFLQHGLAVGIFMSIASVCHFWLWWSKVWPLPGLPGFLRFHSVATLVMLSVTAVACKSFGALSLGLAAVGSLFLADRMKLSLAVWGLLAIPPVYVITRTTGSLPADRIVNMIGSQVNTERSESFEYRIVNEDKFMETMKNNRLFGMGGGVKLHPKDHNGRPLIADGLWIIIYFAGGAVGIGIMISFFVVPAARFLFHCPGDTWSSPGVAPAAIAAVTLAILMIDCLLNAMLNPMFLMLAGALNSWCDALIAWRNRPAEAA
jgi:hypothetical protein